MRVMDPSLKNKQSNKLKGCWNHTWLVVWFRYFLPGGGWALKVTRNQSRKKIFIFI